MTELYLSGGDTLQSVDNPNWQGQTFVIREDFILQFVDLQMRGALILPDPVIQLFYANIDGTPWGNALSRNNYTVEKKSGTFTTGRNRFSMAPFLLQRPARFILIVANFPPLGGNPASWQYDQGDATYPRGYRMSSNDAGATWTPHPGDDFMFALFGSPPLISPEPAPPLENFAAISLASFPNSTGITFTLETSVPCHLFIFITETPPRKYMTSRVTRGLAVPWHVYYSFIEWSRVEQTELADTMTHTFEVPNWEECQTKWFTFRGKVDNINSPSVGPIFKMHHQRTSAILTLRPNAPGERCTISRETGFDCPNHYANVADIVPDEDVTTVYDSPRPGYSLDFYTIQDPPSPVAFITQIQLIARFKANTPPTVKSAHICLNVGGQFYTQSRQFDPAISNPWNSDAFKVTTDWSYYQSIWLQNPVTGNPWTWQDIEDLQIGVALRNPRHIAPTIGKYTYCTQLYIDIKYETLVD